MPASSDPLVERGRGRSSCPRACLPRERSPRRRPYACRPANITPCAWLSACPEVRRRPCGSLRAWASCVVPGRRPAWSRNWSHFLGRRRTRIERREQRGGAKSSVGVAAASVGERLHAAAARGGRNREGDGVFSPDLAAARACEGFVVVEISERADLAAEEGVAAHRPFPERHIFHQNRQIDLRLVAPEVFPVLAEVVARHPVRRQGSPEGGKGGVE